MTLESITSGMDFSIRCWDDIKVGCRYSF